MSPENHMYGHRRGSRWSPSSKRSRLSLLYRTSPLLTWKRGTCSLTTNIFYLLYLEILKPAISPSMWCFLNSWIENTSKTLLDMIFVATFLQKSYNQIIIHATYLQAVDLKVGFPEQVQSLRVLCALVGWPAHRGQPDWIFLNIHNYSSSCDKSVAE